MKQIFSSVFIKDERTSDLKAAVSALVPVGCNKFWGNFVLLNLTFIVVLSSLKLLCVFFTAFPITLFPILKKECKFDALNLKCRPTSKGGTRQIDFEPCFVLETMWMALMSVSAPACRGTSLSPYCHNEQKM